MTVSLSYSAAKFLVLLNVIADRVRILASSLTKSGMLLWVACHQLLTVLVKPRMLLQSRCTIMLRTVAIEASSLLDRATTDDKTK